MLKKLLILAVCLLITTPCFAQLDLGSILEKFPLKQGIGYSIVDHKFNYVSTITIAEWLGLNFEIGYAGAPTNTRHKAVAVISAPIVKLKDLGVTLPILDLIECNLGLYGGWGQIDIGDGMGEGNNEADYGISFSILSVKF